MPPVTPTRMRRPRRAAVSCSTLAATESCLRLGIPDARRESGQFGRWLFRGRIGERGGRCEVERDLVLDDLFDDQFDIRTTVPLDERPRRLHHLDQTSLNERAEFGPSDDL